MKAYELKRALNEGALDKYSALYSNTAEEAKRFCAAIDSFVNKYGDGRDIFVFSVPGRSEIIGNHTDHNNGRVMAGAIDRDIIAVVAKNNDGVVRFSSEGYPDDSVMISDTSSTHNFKRSTSRALVAGMISGFTKNGYAVGGFDAYSTTKVLKGSGLSSSAAFEVMIGNILNHLYNDGNVDNKEIAKIARYSENVFFGKPCGLMDQMACAVGGFVYIDFEDPKEPVVDPLAFSMTDAGYSLCIVNTGGNHANLTPDYAAVPAEMKSVAAILGKEVLRGVTEKELLASASEIRAKANDRALLRAIHFVRENDRVELAKGALLAADLDSFFANHKASGRSSFEYLQNVYTNQNPGEQGLSLALALTEGYLDGKCGSFRVHGGGFAGTIQAFVKSEDLAGYVELMDSVFGKGAAMPLNIRPVGAVKLF